MSSSVPYTQADFAHSPFVMFYEVTRACDLLCGHCRACSQPNRHPSELTNYQAKTLIEQITTFPRPPLVVFTGGDPMKRRDIFDLVAYAGGVGLQTAMTPSATPLVTQRALQELKAAGLGRLALSLDGTDALTHDSFRGVAGSFERTLEILKQAREIGLSIQVNTTITRRNVHQVDAMAEIFAHVDIAMWSVFFLVPVGRGLAEQRIAPEQYEVVFERLWEQARRQPYAIKTTEAHHYRRFVLQRQGDPQRQPENAGSGAVRRAPLGVNDGKGVMFVSHTGSIYPSGFLPVACGQSPQESVVRVYQESALFRALRDPDRLKGKCRACEFRRICGGSRARAYALTRDPLAAEPDCAYIPQEWKETATCSA